MAHVSVGVLQVLSVLRHKAAHSAGTLLMWVLQRPQLIDMDQARGTLAEMLYRSSYCLGLLAVAVKKAHSVSSSSNSIGTHAAAMTQQLEQSGAWHIPMHWAAAAFCPTTLACVNMSAPV
jgi:hypothetical protein